MFTVSARGIPTMEEMKKLYNHPVMTYLHHFKMESTIY